MRGKLIALKIKIGSELPQCTDITAELEDLNIKLEEFRKLMSSLSSLDNKKP
jgi:peroxiredoxin